MPKALDLFGRHPRAELRVAKKGPQGRLLDGGLLTALFMKAESSGGPAGQMHLTIEGATTLLAHIQSGKVRPLAVMSPQRIPALPDVPTMLESGYSGFPSASWTGVLAPAGTPAPIVGKLNAAINDALQSPEISTNFARFSAQAKVGSPQDFAAFIAVEAPKWSALVRDSGAKLE